MATFQVETEQHGELNCWRITSNHAELLIAQQGAQVLSYQRLGEPPLLWLSDQAIFRQGKSVRAGVPVFQDPLGLLAHVLRSAPVPPLPASFPARLGVATRAERQSLVRQTIAAEPLDKSLSVQQDQRPWSTRI